MNISSVVKKLPGAVILLTEIVMFWQSAKLLSLEFLPEWHKWSGRLAAVFFAVFLAVSVALYIFCEIKGKRPALLRIWGIVCLFLFNTLYATPGWLQMVLAVALIVSMIHEGLFKSLASSAAILSVFVICALFSVLLMPSISRIEKPQLYTDLEEFWWNLFDTRAQSSDSGTPVALPTTDSVEGIPDNMITNDVFPESGDAAVCSIKSTYPLQMLHVFSCGDYNPQTATFSNIDDKLLGEDAHSPSLDYYKQAVSENAALPHKAVITDLRSASAMLIAPYCSFSTGADSVMGFSDRFIYRSDYRYSTPVRFTFDPDSVYKYASSGYRTQAMSAYLSLPEDFEDSLKLLVLGRGLTTDETDVRRKIEVIRKMLAEEYTFTNEPPELPDSEDPVMYFLLKSKVGHSKHFAAAEVFLYRAAGIPARYSVGYKVREYVDGEAQVTRNDVWVFCEVFANGAWMLPEDVLALEEQVGSPETASQTAAEVRETEDPVILANGYDISHLKGTASMFGSYDDSMMSKVSRTSRTEDDATVVLVIDSGVAADYIKACSTGDYSYPGGYFTILSDTDPAPQFEEGKSFGEYAQGAFMSEAPAGSSDTAQGFRVFNLFAPRYIYTPVFTVSTEGLAAGSAAAFSMAADRMIVPVSGKAAYDDHTVFKGSESAGANDAYTEYALSKYTKLPEESAFYLKQFLKENGINADDPDKGALIEAVRSLLKDYTYTTQIDTIPEGKDPVLWFLTESKAGYCQHFASAGTLLLRACGIPARFVSGYFKKIAPGSITEITAKDVHAWTEVYDGSGWQLVEMCVGTPAEGQALPSGLRIEEPSYTLPSVEAPANGRKWRLPLVIVLLIAAVCALAVRIAALIKKNKPDAMQQAAIMYRYLTKYYYINDDTQRLLNKINYSKEGAQPDDLKALGQSVSAARSLMLTCRKYFSFASSMILYAFWYLKAAAKNLFDRTQ